MTDDLKKNVCIVCMANYCRSPVAEALFKKKFEDKYNFYSAGLNPMVSAGMDPRSLKFLKEEECNFKIHSPQKIDTNLVNLSDLILAFDPLILNELNRKFKNYKNKFKLFNFQFLKIRILDPYKLSDKEYKDSLKKIKYIVDNLEFENIL